MAIDFKSTFRASNYKTKWAQKHKQEMELVIAVAKRNLISDLGRGLSPDGIPLNNQRKYSEDYAAFKAQKTGRPKGKVDLSLSNQMLNSLQTQVIQTNNETIGRLYFENTFRERVVRNLKKWKFFGFSKATMTYFYKKFGK
jgi:hypothetical protein